MAQQLGAAAAGRPQRRAVAARAEKEGVTGLVKAAKEKPGRAKTGIYFASEQSLSYLDGSLPGDFGFDPLGLSDPEGAGGVVSPEWLAYAEVIHARFAMLGAAGCIAPEIMAAKGWIPESTGILWWQSGVIGPAYNGFPYWTDVFSLFFLQVIFMQFAELRRLQDYRKPGSMGEQYFIGLEYIFKGSGDPAYPGGPFFNLFNLGKDEAALADLKLKEIKNGRLAMVAMFGYGAQAVLTGVGPYQNLADHVTSAGSANILSNLVSAVGGN